MDQWLLFKDQDIHSTFVGRCKGEGAGNVWERMAPRGQQVQGRVFSSDVTEDADPAVGLVDELGFPSITVMC